MPESPAEILLVEDSENDAELVMRALRINNIRHHVSLARDGVEALEFLFGSVEREMQHKAEIPRLVILDLKLPRIDGLEVLRQMKEHPRTRAVPVVMLTSSNEKADVEECYRLGANSYIVKPIDFERFQEIVRNIVLYWLHINKTPNHA